MENTFQLDAGKVAAAFKVDPHIGLSMAEAATRQRRDGRNELKASKKISKLTLFLSQFKDVLIVILLIAAGVSTGVSLLEGHSPTEGILILFIVVAIALVGFFNEYKAEKTVEALKKLAAPQTRVRRGGKIITVDTAELVAGDIVVLESGSKAPADMRLFEAFSLEANEASLTGESLPVSKSTPALKSAGALGDQKNMLFAGTIVTAGKGEGIVVATGMKSEMGKIAGMVTAEHDAPTPMQIKLDKLGSQLGILILGVCVLAFVAILLLASDTNVSFLQRLVFAFTAAVALAVAAIPEGLAFVVRISLALGARRMAAKKALVRHLAAVEALGSTDVICSDKTGTLTAGEMTVTKLWLPSGEIEVTGSGYSPEGQFQKAGQKISIAQDLDLLLKIGALCNNSGLEGTKVSGDPTEAALLVVALKAGLRQDDLLKKHPKTFELPFTSERKMMSTLHKGKQNFLAAKGATEVILDRCRDMQKGSTVTALGQKERQAILEQAQVMSRQALRVLAVAYAHPRLSTSAKEEELTFAGLIGIMDPPRQKITETIAAVTKQAGMRVIMVTGDHIETAKAIAKQIGIEGRAITGEELNKLTDAEFNQQVLEIGVYARVNPEHKIKIVKALKAHKLQVAMTGDGVNDAPAIKAADIGIAMGITGTDVAKETADLILLDDHFETIVAAIAEGRGIFFNVRKFVNYLLSANVAEILIVLSGAALFHKLLISASQLLFINIVTDGLPAVALGSDPAPKDVMQRHPREFQGEIIDKWLWIEIFVFGSIMTVVMLLQLTYDNQHHLSGPIIFSGLVLFELVRLVMIKAQYKTRWRDNPWLIVAVISSVLLLLGVLYIPIAARVFSLTSLPAEAWAQFAVLSVALFLIMKPITAALTKLRPR